MSWWKTLFGGSSTSTFTPEPEFDFSDLSPNEDALYPDAARFVLSTGRSSVSAVQHHLKIGYIRAARLVEALEEDGIITGIDSNGVRHLLSKQQREAARLLPSKAEVERQRKAEELTLRTAYLSEKYGNDAVVQAILSQKIWEGMTAAQLFDSAGEPEAIDQKYMKTKSREVWKYDHQGSNRYLLRVTLEDGLVVGWDSKG
ncbi:hypothetical protein C1Y35_19690 [Pseudomonas sp. GW456-L14]|uniref:DNA translocase FtsK n=1 Tax=unclassified Pseudomonas TaxID=196821 RepID=UPI000C8893A6|nr:MULTISPECIES: DNA translocase FtsK [unclassified Pseudomonas]PMY37311.1 hypothetical protein C1Y35_19690 [Pseudomonas sp. GW456-L14]